jgi:hypothetical protein
MGLLKQNLLVVLAAMAAVGAAVFRLAVFARRVPFSADWRQSRQIETCQRQLHDGRAENVRRLDNGCDRNRRSIGALPADLLQCGLTREKPPGDCDHVWRERLIPASRCENAANLKGGQRNGRYANRR